MAVDVLALVALIFQAGSEVIGQCSIVQQCAGEAARIALRTQNVLGLLQVGEEELLSNVPFECSLLYLRETLEGISVLLERCKQPARLSAKARRAFRMKATRAALLETEANLERVTSDLKLPVLADINILLNKRVLAPPDANAAENSTTPAGATAGIHHESSMSETLKFNLDEENCTIEEARGMIEQGMRSRTNGDALVEDVIQDELAKSGGPLSVNLATLPDSGKCEGDHLALKRVLFDGLLEEEPLGHGTFGAVLAGRYKNGNVAVKKARGPISTQTLQDFRKEAEMQYLLRHANIVKTIAFSVGDDINPPRLIMERMHESLFARLASKIDFPAALGIVLDVCKAVRFLHGYGIVHKNIKSPNVLLDRRGKAKLSDFSLADISETINGETGGGYHRDISTQFWMAPEVVAHKRASARSADVFSFHVVAWEAISNQRAGTGTPIGEMLLDDPGAKLSLVGTASAPAPLLKRMQHLLDRCGSFRSQDRPTMIDITPEVEVLHREASGGGGCHRGKAVHPTGGAAAVPPVAEPTARAEPAFDNGSWPENSQETGLWSPAWFSTRQLHHESGSTAAPQSPVDDSAHDDVEHLSASEPIGVGGTEGIAAEETAAPPAAIVTPAATGSTIVSGSAPVIVHEHPEAVPWSPHWLWEGRRTLSTTEKHPGDEIADEATSSGGDGGNVGGEERVVRGAETARLGVTTVVALAAAVEAANAFPPWKPDSSYSIMTTSDSGFQQRYVTKPEDEKLGEIPSNADALFVAGAARVPRNADDEAEEFDAVETPPYTENNGATARGHGDGMQGWEAAATTVAAAGAQERVEPRVVPRAEDEREKQEGELVTDVTSGTEVQERARGGNVPQQGEEEKEIEGEEGEDEEEQEDGDEHALIPTAGLHRDSSLPTSTCSASRRRQHDRSILMALFERCRGSQWPDRDNWGSAQPLSEWYNVTVDGADHVTRLVLSRNRLSGELPAELGMLAFLRELYLHKNHLRGRIPPCIGGLSSLVILDLHANKLCGGIPKEIGNLSLLENLSLGNNNLSGPIPAEIGHLRSLRLVSLQRNLLTGPIPTEFGDLRALTELTIGRNRLTGDIPPQLGQLGALQSLDLSCNNFEGGIPSELGKLSRLIVLALHDNQLSGNIPSAVRNLTQMNLLHLELAGNDLAD